MATNKKKSPKEPDKKGGDKNTDEKRDETVKNDKFSPGEPDDYNAEEFSTD